MSDSYDTPLPTLRGNPHHAVFVPAASAAICADSMCGGVFMAEAGVCPGCGGRQWVLLASMTTVTLKQGIVTVTMADSEAEMETVTDRLARRARKLKGDG